MLPSRLARAFQIPGCEPGARRTCRRSLRRGHRGAGGDPRPRPEVTEVPAWSRLRPLGARQGRGVDCRGCGGCGRAWRWRACRSVSWDRAQSGWRHGVRPAGSDTYVIPTPRRRAHTNAAACLRRGVGSSTLRGGRPAPGRRGSCWSTQNPGGLGRPPAERPSAMAVRPLAALSGSRFVSGAPARGFGADQRMAQDRKRRNAGAERQPVKEGASPPWVAE
jgi:hypothetical protein